MSGGLSKLLKPIEPKGKPTINTNAGKQLDALEKPEPKNSPSGPYRDDPDSPGEIIINWDYDDGGGETLRQFKANEDQRLLERYGDEWMEQNRARLDKEFKDILVRGLLT